LQRLLKNSSIVLWLSVCALVGLWLSVPSSVFMKPVSLAVRDGDFIFVRETPFGSVTGRWTQEVRSDLGECAEQGRNPYQDQGLRPVRYAISDALAPCIPDPGEIFVVDTVRTIYLFDIIPLRGHRTVWSCEVENGPCERLE
jgi:hypothetical protein